VGVVGGGQLARMLQPAAVALGVRLRLLADTPADSAAQVIPDTVVGDYRDLDTLRAFAEMIPGIEADAAVMRRAAEEGHSTATDLADYLVKKGLPFRDAHEAVAQVVRLADERGCTLAELRLADLQAVAPQIETDVYGSLATLGALAARNHTGGTAPVQVRSQAQRWRARLGSPPSP